MKRNILNIALVSVTLAAAALTSCKENELDPKKAGEGKKISFAISEANTRTEYDASDNLQINWTEGDKVRIYCAEAEDVKDAEYTVSQISNNTGKLDYNAEGLAWGGDDLIHNFYAVYPSDTKMIAGVTDGKVTVNANLNQICTLGAKDASGMYNTIPDMTNAVMVANLSTKPVDEVALTFKPIMTTLEVIVRGYENENLGVDVTGISINMDASAYGASSKQFIYDIKAGDIVRGDLNSTVQFFVGVKGSTSDNIVHLTKGESVKFTAFLPPVAVNDAHKIKIRVHATGATELVATIGGNTLADGSKYEIAQSTKRKITLPWIEVKNNSNNWITPLDDSIYVQQLSIPGTHDSAANETSLADAGQTQSKTIDEQFKMGIRAYDLRTAYNSNQGRMWMYHGYSNCYKSLNTVLTTLSNALKENKDEFIIIQFRHESESSIIPGGTEKDPDKWDEIYNELKNFDDQIIPWRNNLTVGDCRGKMIILTRHDYNNRTKAALVGSFPENSFGEANLNGSTKYYVQDYYKYRYTNSEDSNGKKKIQLIETLMKTTSKFCDKNSSDFINKSWALNHTSGYCATVIGLGSTSQYQHNASFVNPVIYDYLQNQTNPGPLGIIFMDWVGARDASSYTVYGDLLPQTIIDHNYMYHMLRKGE